MSYFFQIFLRLSLRLKIFQHWLHRYQIFKKFFATNKSLLDSKSILWQQKKIHLKTNNFFIQQRILKRDKNDKSITNEFVWKRVMSRVKLLAMVDIYFVYEAYRNYQFSLRRSVCVQVISPVLVTIVITLHTACSKIFQNYFF